jgi:hypothetical protein
LEYASKAPQFEGSLSGGIISETVDALTDWRAQYLAGRVMLTDGFGFQHTSNHSTQAFYKTWSFMELSSALVRNGAADATAHNFVIQPTGSEASISQHGRTFSYFDRAARLFRPAQSGWNIGRHGTLLLPHVHPEWLLYNPARYAEGAVLGSYYEGSSTADQLELLGHSRNYGVRNTVVVARKEPELAMGTLLVNGLRASGPNRTGETFYSLLLLPDAAREAENMHRLDVLIKRLDLR